MFQDYEHALIYYHRGLKRATFSRRNIFKVGIKICTDVIMKELIVQNKANK